jgi:hypothetical protein
VNDVEEGGEAVHFMKFAGQCGGEVEAKPVYMHLEDPVAQTIHD